MFTGLVQTTGVVRELRAHPESRRIVIAAELAEADRAIGASVCVSGVCLTVVESSPTHFAADVAFETLAVTTLGELREGSRVNLEPSLRLGDSLGGHLVSGHVDGVGTLRSVEPRGDAREVWVFMPEPLRRYVAVKGSVAVDGVSLTVNRVDETGFMVGLIPHTLEVTTLGDKLEQLVNEGAPVPVNLEVDMLARYVERLLSFKEPS
ncbi:MAG TPA: riboflavin synthase [Enhygromyxa sp.]|nr:riboflavin synthase [Enhygromyxa sp.]